MPSVNLRLSDEQHAELVAAGQRENRSLQREIIYRLFGDFSPVPVSADAQSRDVTARSVTGTSPTSASVSIQTSGSTTQGPAGSTVSIQQDTFHPDPKPAGKKK